MEVLGLFFAVLATVFVAEMGDKTQLMLIAMTSKYKIRDIIFGTAVAILVLNGLAVVAGGFLNVVLNKYLWIVKLVACAAFFYFSITSLCKDDDEEEAGDSKFNFAPVAVFCTFFVAELGDKTQLASLMFGATNGLNSNAIIIWIAASIGLFAADIIGLVIGYFLHGKTPDSFFNFLSFVIFAVFGFVNLPSGLYLALNPNAAENKTPSVSQMILETPYALVIMISVAFVFLALCSVVLLRKKRTEK